METLIRDNMWKNNELKRYERQIGIFGEEGQIKLKNANRTVLDARG